MKIETYEATLEDGSMVEYDVEVPDAEQPKDILSTAKDIAFNTVIDITGGPLVNSVRNGLNFALSDKAEPVIKGIADYSLSLTDNALSIAEESERGHFGFTSPSVSATASMVGKLFGEDKQEDDQLIKFTGMLRDEVQKKYSGYMNDSNASESDKFVYELTQGTMSLATSIGLTMATGNPQMASAMFGLVRRADTYNKAVSEGVSEDKAQIAATQTMTTEMVWEALGLSAWTKYLRGSFTGTRIVGRIASEITEEIMQDTSAYAIESAFGIDKRSIEEFSQELARTALIAGITASPVSVFHTSIENSGLLGQTRSLGIPDKKIFDLVEKRKSSFIKATQEALLDAYPQIKETLLKQQVEQTINPIEIPAEDILADKPLADMMPVIPEEIEISGNEEQVKGRKTKTQKVIEDSFKIKEDKKFTESKALNIGFKKIERYTREAFRDGKKSVQAVQKEIVDAVKKLPKKYRGNFIHTITNAKNEKDVMKALEKVANKSEKAYRDATIEVLQKKLNKIIDSSMVDASAREAIRTIAGQIDFKVISQQNYEKLIALRDSIVRQIEEGRDVYVPKKIVDKLARLYRTPVKDISTDELQGLLNDVIDIELMGRTDLSLRQAQRTEDIKRKQSQLIDATKSADKGWFINESVGWKDSLKDKVIDTWNKLVMYDIITTPMPFLFDRFDGGQNNQGAHYQILYDPINRRFSDYLDMQGDIQKDIMNLVHDLKLTEDQYVKISIHAALQSNYGKDVIAAALESGYLKDQEVRTAETLTADENKLYEKMRYYYETVYPLIKQTMREVYNKDVGHAKNYFHLGINWAEQEDEALKVEELFSQSIKQTAKKNFVPSFTKKRRGLVNKPLLHSLHNFMSYIDRAAYLVNMASQIRDAYEIVNNDEYKKNIGEKNHQVIRKWVELLARQGASEWNGATAPLTEKLARNIRHNVGLSRMLFKVTSAAIQPTSLFQGATLLGHYVARGMSALLEHNVRKFVMEAVPELKHRIGDDRAYAEFSQNKYERAGFYVLKNLDALSAAAVTTGAMLKWCDENKVDFYNMSDTDISKASEYASDILRRTQSSPYFKDSAPIITQYGEAGKLWSQFQSFAYTQWNLLRHTGYHQLKDKDFKKFANLLMWQLVTIIFGTGINRLYREGMYALMDKEFSESDTYATNIVNSAFGASPYTSPIASIMIYGSSPIPALNALRDIGFGRSKNKVKTSIRLLLSLAGLFAGAPTAQLDDIIDLSFELLD